MELVRATTIYNGAKQLSAPNEIGDNASLRQNIEKLKEREKALRSGISTHITVTLPAVYAELAKLHSTSILLSDYNLKLARQCYHVSRQDKVRSWIYPSLTTF